ncbi:hypothetical protein HYDPIDRAFT_105005 [Hydnomerulius pinastri MD-312]|nr:hypothetical protein HYDPIDRAFT_105005 [Hydnomerulius pinastri MD-312]
MAKSTRSKVKRSFRAKKRQTGIYAATEAARLNRLNAKLVNITEKDKDGDMPLEDAEGAAAESEDDVLNAVNDREGMELDGADQSQLKEGSSSVSTHGPRGSRREQWRKSKGMDPVPKRHGMNRQGGLAARRKAGRPSRRR